MLQLEAKALDLPERAACVANLPRQHKQAVAPATCLLSTRRKTFTQYINYTCTYLLCL